jgi:hypothetical protein
MGLTFVQGDTGPDIEATIHLEDPSTTPVDLTHTDGVKFQMRKPDDRRFTVNAVATVLDAEAGTVKYSWGANDLSVPGDYECQWEVTFEDGKVITTAFPVTITVRRQ